jgi:hypothetical protein
MAVERNVAIVAGGATSIGAAIVRGFAARGDRVVVADIDETAGMGLAREIGDDALFCRVDLASDTEIQECVRRAVETFGRIDYVVGAAASYLDEGPASPREHWRAGFDVNVFGPVILVHAAYEQLRENKGCVVHLGSISGQIAQKGRWVYPAAKAALHQLTRSQALEFAEDGVRVNAVVPGWTWAGGMEKLGLTRPLVDRVAAPFHLTGRAADREEVADVVLFLCSSAARIVNGAMLPADGGYLALGPEAKASALVDALQAAAESESS